VDIFNEKEWTYKNSKQAGLPRPYAHPPLEDQFTFDSKRFLAPRVPIPWQTAPDYTPNKQNHQFVSLIVEREKQVYKEELCAYCAVKFKPEDDAVIWINYDQPITVDGARVYSDYHPFHLECMNQTRLFFPHMKKTVDSEYKYGKYQELKAEVIATLDSIGYTGYKDWEKK
jgi:hypothetical protein